MSNVPVQRAAEEDSLPARWLEESKKFFEQVRHKAFELFERHGGEDGHHVEHWLEAERELVSESGCEILDADGKFEARVGVPGFDAKQIEVTVVPGWLMVKAEAAEERKTKEGGKGYTEFSERSLFRRIPIPETVDTALLTAKLENGVLKIAAGPGAEEKEAAPKSASAKA